MKITNYYPWKLIINFSFSLLLVLMAISGLNAQDIMARNQVNNLVSLKVQNQSIDLILKEIERQTEFVFIYSNDKISADKKLSLNIKNKPINEVLDELLTPLEIDFRIYEKQIVLSNKITNLAPKQEQLTNKQSKAEKRSLIKKMDNQIIQYNAAQDIIVTGVVTSTDDGIPLPGVNVLVKGTINGTVTDLEGKYSIAAPADAILVYSYVGYTTFETAVSNRSVIDIQLETDITALEEIVVVGYGTQTKRDVSGSITSIKPEEINQFRASSMDAMLQGQGTGIQVAQASGIPGAPVRVLVRGVSSLSAQTEPLWVIDGMIISNPVSGVGGGNGATPINPMTLINPNDIENIEVLKDAAATAIYGSRGANGVIIVTTKTGKKGKGEISLDYSTGISNPTRSYEDMGYTTGDQWLQLVNLGRSNAGLPLPIESELNTLSQIATFGDTLGRGELTNTNWYDELLQTGRFQEMNLSASRGFEGGSFYISANYRTDDGVVKNNQFDRFITRANLEFEPVSNLKAGLRLNLSYAKSESPALAGGGPCCNDQVARGGILEATGRALPIFPIEVTREGVTDYWNTYSGTNLLFSNMPENYRNTTSIYRVLGGFYAEYNVPFISGLSLRTEVSADISQNHTIYWASPDLRLANVTFASDGSSTRFNYLYNAVANYLKTMGDHEFAVTVGTESQEFSSRGVNLIGEDMRGLNQDIGSPQEIFAASGGFGGEVYLRSYFGRVNYKFKDRYLVGASFRTDGSSKFVAGNRWSQFPAASLGWIISEEAFMSSVNAVDFLKLRVSYGATGNQEINNNATETTILNWPVYSTLSGFLISNYGARDLVWEKKDTYEFGADYGFFNGRINGSIGYYFDMVTGMLFQVPTTPSAGLGHAGSSIWNNIADLTNRGFEFNVTTVNIDKGDFRWSTNFNYSTAHNEIQSINPELDRNGQGLNFGATRNIKGTVVGQYFLAEYAGVDPETGLTMIYEIDRTLFSRTGQTVKTGNVLPATNANIGNHRMLQDGKTGLPTFFGGFGTTVEYKTLSLNAQFTYQGGNYIINDAELGNVQIGTGGSNLRSDLIGNSWTTPGQATLYPRLMWFNRHNINNDGLPVFQANGTPNNNQNWAEGGNNITTRYLYRGDFLRLRTLQLSYGLPLSTLKGIQNARIFIAGNNLLTWTRFPGWDPEDAETGGVLDRNLGQGRSGNFIPQLRTYSAGINLTF